MAFNGVVKKLQAVMAFVLGIASLVAVFVSLLALTDIYHGESDLRLEWMALRICFAVIFIFQVFALVTFWSMIRSENPRAGKG
ncbi:MAG: hypothetical protein NTW95_01410 [Candidatus Aminicenantes bacterium]|nr:hypothetical protein [Candidatus Aminicenantes bacterium]